MLRSNYIFLRRIESALRRVENVSVSRIPADPGEQQRLARRLGFATTADFLAAYRHATQRTREIYNELLATD
jgi:glutamate-ammonia-ligase adenylyltransferase